MTNLSWPVVIIDQAGDMHKGTLSNASKDNIREMLYRLIEQTKGDAHSDRLGVLISKEKLIEKIESL